MIDLRAAHGFTAADVASVDLTKSDLAAAPAAPSVVYFDYDSYVVREGDTAEEILKLIDEDEDIAVLILAAAVEKEGEAIKVNTRTGEYLSRA